MADRRLENRYLCAELVRVDWLAGENMFSTLEAILEDISPQGACVQLEVPVPMGSAIWVSCGDRCFDGFVSYCVAQEHGYFIGVRLADTAKWSAATFEPKHLTNLRSYMGEGN